MQDGRKKFGGPRRVLNPQVTGVDLIAKERTRQIEKEGYDAENDDVYEHQLVRAAQCYLLVSRYPLVKKPNEVLPASPPPAWPWDDEFWKPNTADPIPNLVKAGALIAAEIDRLLRVELIQKATVKKKKK